MTYSVFTNACRKAGIEINRKMLAYIAMEDPQGFTLIVEQAKAALS